MSRGKGRVPSKPDKANLPSRVCPVCQRPFTWRKKWARDWENVRYCSDACRRATGTSGSET
ncbi:DUF2256 domain-containing protein [Asaia prunellae]|uniref:DUF2256 domain-containing protein n=1 Tax=Asaia prunellae TaxID=610245 RepID=UPI000A02F77E|nr:DUF2256 domain-containing protein [Asaia prunellae]